MVTKVIGIILSIPKVLYNLQSLGGINTVGFLPKPSNLRASAASLKWVDSIKQPLKALPFQALDGFPVHDLI